MSGFEYYDQDTSASSPYSDRENELVSDSDEMSSYSEMELNEDGDFLDGSDSYYAPSYAGYGGYQDPYHAPLSR